MMELEEDNFNRSIVGVIINRTVRSTFCTLVLMVLANKDEDEKGAEARGAPKAATTPPSDQYRQRKALRIQFDDEIKSLRSHCRRTCKLGDQVQVEVGEQAPTAAVDTGNHCHTTDVAAGKQGWKVHVASIVEFGHHVRVLQPQLWTISQCQEQQQRFHTIVRPTAGRDAETSSKSNHNGGVASDHSAQSSSRSERIVQNQQQRPCCWNPHDGSNNTRLMKKIQSQTMAEFLIQMIAKMHGLGTNCANVDKPESIIVPSPAQILEMDDAQHHERPYDFVARNFLNTNGGVWDVAGGTGHIAAALSLRGIRCTVIDPRATAGQLPRRDRKAYAKDVHRLLLRQQQTCVPIETDDIEGKNSNDPTPNFVPFETLRAWLGDPPEGVDVTFRNVDQASLPVLNTAHCSAIVALHPDEATDAIVDLAVRYKVPFCIVPCCVFGRLFPHRTIDNGGPVSTISQLLDYLQAKHPSIQRATLAFPGANTILWSSFNEHHSTVGR